MEEEYKNHPFSISEGEEEQILKPSEQEDRNNLFVSRPTIITVLCGYFFVGWCLNIINWFVVLFRSSNVSFNLTGFGTLRGWVGLIISCLLVIAIFGYWFMRKWGVYLYTGIIVFNIVYILFKLRPFSPIVLLSFLLPIAVIIIGFKYLNRM